MEVLTLESLKSEGLSRDQGSWLDLSCEAEEEDEGDWPPPSKKEPSIKEPSNKSAPGKALAAFFLSDIMSDEWECVEAEPSPLALP